MARDDRTILRIPRRPQAQGMFGGGSGGMFGRMPSPMFGSGRGAPQFRAPRNLPTSGPNVDPGTLGALGRFGDTSVVHVGPMEEKVLKAMGGAGTVNPLTGLREYFNTDGMKRSKNVIPMTNKARIMPSRAMGGGMGLMPLTRRAPQNPDSPVEVKPPMDEGMEAKSMPQMMIPEHMVDPLLADLPRLPPLEARVLAQPLMAAMRRRYGKMAAMQRKQK